MRAPGGQLRDSGHDVVAVAEGDEHPLGPARPTAAAMAGVTSPSMASAMTMPRGPTMMSAVRQATTTAFSPVAARCGPALSIAEVAAELVPTAVTAASGQGLPDGRHQLPAHATSLGVDDENLNGIFHNRSPFSVLTAST